MGSSSSHSISAYDYMRDFRVTKLRSNLVTYENYDIGCSNRHRAKIIHYTCTGPREEPFVRFVVHNPRSEYTQNLYHAMEEVYSLFQTAWLLGLNLSNVELVLVRPYKILPRLQELFKLTVAKVSIRSHFEGCHVQPLRACAGSYLPYTWSYRQTMQPDALSLDLRRLLRSKLPLCCEAYQKNRSLLMTRRHARSRMLRRVGFFHGCMRSEGHTMVFEGLSQMTMVKQIQLVAESYAVLGPHGAGLTLSMFLPRGGALVEVTDSLRSKTMGRSVHNIYRNLALMTDHYYYSISTNEKNCDRIRHALRNSMSTV
jgi:hypothetical protein